jgi:acetylornithine deacetylase/succinyl-diaminopimelate desuccinylase-like protein
MSTAHPVLVERDSPGMRAAVAALQATFGVKPVFKLEGGTVPLVSMVKTILGVDAVQMGFGLPDDNFHGPNEKLHLPNYYHGVEAYIRFFDLIGG